MKHELYGIKLTLTGIGLAVIGAVMLGIPLIGVIVLFAGAIFAAWGIYEMWKKPMDEGVNTAADEAKQLATDLTETVKPTRPAEDTSPAEGGEEK